MMLETARETMKLKQEVITKYELSNIQAIVAPTSLNTLYSAYSEIFKSKVVLKFHNNSEECSAEANFLKTYQSDKIFVRLFDSMPSDKLMVIEKIEPGDSYALDFPQNENLALDAICVVVDWMRNQKIEISNKFRHVSNYQSSLRDEYERIYKLPIKKCKSIFNELLSEAGEQYLLHGDLHHENILKSESHEHGFTVIDPKGIIGECYFELAGFILNPISELAFHKNAENIITSRIKILSTKLDLDIQRLTKWCFVKTVLCASFAIEDNLLETYKKFDLLAHILNVLLLKSSNDKIEDCAK